MSSDSIKATESHIERDLNIAVTDYDSRVLDDDRIECWSEINHKLQQKSLVHAIDHKTYTTLIFSSSDRRRAQLIRSASNKATAWARVLPNSEYGEKFSNNEMDVILSRFLGQPISVLPQICTECHMKMDIYGDHAITCKTGKGRHHRHDIISNMMSNILHTCKINHELELMHIMCKTGKGRPADIWIPAWDDRKDYALDIGVTSECCLSNINSSKNKSMSAAQKYYNHKMSAFKRKTRHTSINFIYQPLIFESSGAMHASTMNFISMLGNFRAAKLNILPSVSIAHCNERISARLQKGNAIAIGHHYPARAGIV